MGGIAESDFFDANNTKLHKDVPDDQDDNGAPTLQILCYRDAECTEIANAKLNHTEPLELGRKKSLRAPRPLHWKKGSMKCGSRYVRCTAIFS